MTPSPNERLPPTRQAARLGAFARGLGCTVGIERSCKLRPGAFDAGRFLLSFAADERTVRLTGRLLRELSLPGALDAAFQAAAPSARFLHLGYEDSGVGAVFKVYCEGEPGAQDGVPLYTAYKWSPAAASLAVDDYRLRRDPGLEDMQTAMSQAFGAGREDLADACLGLLDGRHGGIGLEDVMFLDVERRGGPRRSFDLRLYGSGLRVGDIRPMVDIADSVFGLGGGALRRLAEADGSPLGHVSGGRGEGGDAFLTLYFGAEDFA
jgi:hypothetical protein